jgi:hypothetical protein
MVDSSGKYPERSRGGQQMTRKDYEAIAETMNEEIHGGTDPYAWMSMVNALAFKFKKQNDRFNIHIFRNACGWEYCTGVKSETV